MLLGRFDSTAYYCYIGSISAGGEDDTDKYCKFCGTPKGEGKFEPYKNMILVVYGPPITLKYMCNQCNAKWNSFGVSVEDEIKYCPQCKSTDIKMVKREYLL